MRKLTAAVALWLAWVAAQVEPVPSALLFIAALALALRLVGLAMQGLGESP